MPIDHDHSYKFYDERPENAPKKEVESSDDDDEEDDDEAQIDISIEQLLFDVQVLDSATTERKRNLSNLKSLLLSLDHSLLARFIPTLNRLSIPGLCPLKDVQTTMGQIMGALRQNEKSDPSKMRSNVPRMSEMSPSRFFKISFNAEFDFDEKMKDGFFKFGDSDDYRQNLSGADLRKLLLAETWNQFHRIDNLSLILATHPTYFDYWRKFHGALIFNESENDGLCRIEKIYIAIMAASASKSTYLYYLLLNEFKSDPDFMLRPEKYSDWIDVGYDKIPQKMRDLCELNEKMVNCPWLIEPDQITKLTHRTKDQWRLSELIQAVLIIAWIHANAVFCFGIGINPEIDASRKFSNSKAPRAKKSEPKKMKKSDSEISIDIQDTVVQLTTTDSEDEEDATETLRTRMAMISRIRTESESRQDIDEQEMQATNLENFRRLNRQPGTFSSDHESDSDEQFNQEMFKHLSPSHRLNRQTPLNNNNLLNEETELRLQEFNWKSKTVPCALDIISDQLRRIDNDVVYLLDEKFAHIQSLTYHKMGKEPVDTEIFRHGVWNFAHCRLGIMSSDCNYDHLERLLLDDDWRRYLEKIMKSHHDITRHDYHHFCTGLENDEKVHVNLLCLEARFQAELLYTMRCFNNSLCTI